MIKSTKHLRHSEMELMPPIKGINNVTAPDLIDTLTAQKFDGAIENRKAASEYGFRQVGSGYFKIFDFIIDGRKKLYGYDYNGISEIAGSRVVSISGLSAADSTIRWDNQFLTLSGGDLYLGSEKVVKNEGFVQASNSAPVVNGSIVELDGVLYVGDFQSLYSVKGADTVQLQTTGDYSKMFVWNKDIYCMRYDLLRKILYIYVLDIKGQVFEHGSVNCGEIASMPCVIDDNVYFSVKDSDGSTKSIWHFNMVNKATSKYYELQHSSTFLGIYKQGLELIIIGAYTFDIIRYECKGVLRDSATLPSQIDTQSANTVLTVKGRHFLYYNVRGAVPGNPAATNTTESWLYDLDKKIGDKLKFVAQNMTVGFNDVIYAVGANFTASKRFIELSGQLFSRDGRVGVVASDMITFSGIGDPANWVVNNEDDSIFIDIGYKEGGHVTGTVNAYDLIVFKDNGKVYRLSGSYPNWTVNTIANIEPLTSNVKYNGNSILFGTLSGVKELIAGNIYGDYLVNDMRSGINMSDCKFIYISQLRQSFLFVFSDGIYEYLPQYSTYTRISKFVPDMIGEDDNNIYALKDTFVYKMYQLETVHYEYGRVISGNRFLINSITLNAAGSGIVDIQIGNKTYSFQCNSDEAKKYKKRNICTTDVMEPKITITGGCDVCKIIIEYSVIGG